jgi:hypothetical protein
MASAITGCGDDIQIYRPPVEKNSFLPLTSPANIVHNIALAYNLQDCERIEELLCEDFVFVFSDRDISHYRDWVPQEGLWGCDDEVDATCNMFDTNYVPEDPLYKVDRLEMSLHFSGSLTATNREEAPPGTLEGYVSMDLNMDVGGGAATFLCRSRPLFYFAPDSTQSPTLWCLWRCEDSPFVPELLNSVAGADLSDRETTEHRALPLGRSAVQRGELAAPASETTSWGIIKLVYWDAETRAGNKEDDIPQ